MRTLPIESLERMLASETQFNGGAFTVRGRKTGKDYTYKIRRKKYKGINYIQCYTENQYLRWNFLGTFNGMKITRRGNRIEGEAGRGLEWILRRVVLGESEKIGEQAELFHLGKCVKCGRTLTDAESIERGMGEYCARH